MFELTTSQYLLIFGYVLVIILSFFGFFMSHYIETRKDERLKLKAELEERIQMQVMEQKRMIRDMDNQKYLELERMRLEAPQNISSNDDGMLGLLNMLNSFKNSSDVSNVPAPDNSLGDIRNMTLGQLFTKFPGLYENVMKHVSSGMLQPIDEKLKKE